ncbi:MAG: DUF4011 domain-containing protein [Lachnospiraceae bacterium]|nr:DUF4011 domain-containing protein [Lachnospiraceae bacterium]
MAVQIHFTLPAIFQYAAHLNAKPFVEHLTVRNTGREPAAGELRITASPAVFQEYTESISLEPGETKKIADPVFTWTPEPLLAFTEAADGTVQVQMRDGEKILAEKSITIPFQTLDLLSHWEKDFYQIAAYVTPNHPLIPGILSRVSELLAESGNGYSISAYQGGSKEKVIQYASCLFRAVAEQKIAYISSRPTYLPGYQRIRMAGDMLSEHAGNCIEFSLLFASCLEAMGLHPFVISLKTDRLESHAICGLWLNEKGILDQPVSTDPSFFRKKCGEGNRDIILFEATCASRGKYICGFQAAAASAEAHLYEKIDYFRAADISRSRKAGVTPMPSLLTGRQMAVLQEEAGRRVPAGDFSYPVPEERQMPGYTAAGKKEKWINRLLDLSARSPLLNLSLSSGSSKAVPVLTAENRCWQLYDKFGKNGRTLRITGRPEDFEASSRSAELFERMSGARACQDVILASLGQDTVHTDLEDGASARLLSAMRKEDTETRDQTGSGALCLAFGMIRWMDGRKKQPHYAPLILAPAMLIKEGRSFRIRPEGAIQYNEAVFEFLRKQKGLHLAHVSDSDGQPDFRKCLPYLRDALALEPDLDVFENAVLGIFEFSRSVLWKDLNENMDEYQKHPFIRGLLTGELPEDLNKDAKPSRLSELVLPLPADASQKEAIAAALGGESCVMHGPPGTGKTQVIADMVSGLIYAGKRVIFSAEKAPAMNVVYDRLSQISLTPFCLYLTPSSRKESFLEQMREAKEAAEAETQADGGYDIIRQELTDAAAELERMDHLLHGARLYGSSACELLSEYLLVEEYLPPFSLEEDFVDTLAKEKMHEYEEALHELTEAGRHTGHPYGHPLSDWGTYEYYPSMAGDIRPALEAYQDALQSLAAQIKNLEMSAGFETGDTTYEGLEMASRKLRSEEVKEKLLQKLPAALRSQSWPLTALKQWILAGQYQQRRDAILGHCREPYRERFFTLPLEKMLEQWKKGMLDLRFRRQHAALRGKLLSFLGEEAEKWNDGKITKFLEMACLVKKQETQVQKIRAVLPSIEADGEFTLETAATILALLEKAFQSEEELAEFAAGMDSRSDDGLQFFASQVKTLEAASRKLAAAAPVPALWHQGGETLEEALAAASRWQEGLDDLKEWSGYLAVRRRCEELQLSPFIRLYESGLPHDGLFPSFRAACCHALLQRLYSADKDIRSFSGFQFEDLAARYRETMGKYYEASARKIRGRLAERAHEALAHGPGKIKTQMTSLNRMIQSGGKGMSIRSMMDLLPDLIPVLAPCMILSPASAALYLGPGWKADAVIFDEASQIQTPAALGLIARTKQVIIAGDPNQMPPTSFFDAAAEGDVDDNPLDADQESILKEALALSLPNHYLQWHYRSTHESLISFPNGRYYGGKMMTFPSADRRLRVHFRNVRGVYDRGHSMTNRTEAEACIAYLAEKLLSGDRRTYGIITFNIHQKALLLSLLEEEAAGNHQLEQALGNMEEKGEPLFIRNLECVQGDERDVILFSTGYGPDAKGRLTMNFGPLAQAGGHKRLNVALTRARDEMLLFTSLDPEQIRITPGSGRGVRDFRDFLLFARGNGSETVQTEEETDTDGFRMKICGFLRESGYQCDTLVGTGRFRVDIGIRDPADPDRYVLGLILDTSQYCRNLSVQDREAGQMELLRDRGWNLLWVFSLDWFDDPIREQHRILRNLPPLPAGQAAATDAGKGGEKIEERPE